MAFFNEAILPGAPVLGEPLVVQRLGESQLATYLAAELPGLRGPLAVRQFQGGQSNPTYHLHAPDAEFVLRKKPSASCPRPPMRWIASTRSRSL